MTEEVRWTPAGRAALDENRRDVLRDKTDAELKETVWKAAKRLAPAWKRARPRVDEEGKAALALAEQTLLKKKLPKRPSVDDAARLLSLIGASGSEFVPPLGELVIREYGLAFAMAVAARMWSHKSASHNPDWPKSEKRAAVWIVEIEDDDDSVHDASCSYSKSAFTTYLASRNRGGTAAERTEMRKGVTAIWKTVPPHARPALAYATNDPKRAKESALELIEAGESPWPHFAWDHLPYVVDDAELAIRILRDNNLSLDLIKNLGTAIWPLYEERIASHIDGRSRGELLKQFSNFYGPRTALLLAEYEDTKECAEVVREYFTLYPELLDKVIDEPSLEYHREDLQKLRESLASAPETKARRGAG